MLMPVALAALDGPRPEGVDDAYELLDRVDLAFACGLARLGPDEAQALTALAAAMAATPLGRRVGEAVEKILTGSADDGHLALLAGARTAVLGAVHDALLAQLDTALGRTRAGAPDQPPGACGITTPDGGHPDGEHPDGDAASRRALAGCRAWLQELALVGWRGVDHDIAGGGGQAVSALLADPALRRPAVLLDGLAAELRACSPIATLAQLPARRWADLWARGLLLTQPDGVDAGTAPDVVSGRLFPLGVDVQEHPTAVQVQVHGLLEPASGGPARLVRWSVSSTKVDTISGPALWRLFVDQPVLLGSLAQGRGIEISDLPLRASGDFVWDERRAALGGVADPFTSARLLLPDAVGAVCPPHDRHPVHLREPVLVEGFTTTNDETGLRLRLGDHSLVIDVGRLPACGPLTAALVAAAEACIGLLRHDGEQWLLQPLTVRTTVKRKPALIGTGDWALGPTDPKAAKAVAKTGNTLEVLRERAGRLLRA